MRQYNPREVVQVAIDVEHNGEHFYGAMARETNNKEMKGLLMFLKEQETKHAVTFQKILEGIDEFILTETDAGGDYDAYFRAVASLYIFTPQVIKEKIEKGFSSDMEVVAFAMQIEKDSILTYLALRKYIVPQKQSVIDAVIHEEEMHLVRLTAMRDEMIAYTNKQK